MAEVMFDVGFLNINNIDKQRKMTSAIDHNVNIARKKDDSIKIREDIQYNRHCINQINANGITDEITIIIKNEQIAQKKD